MPSIARRLVLDRPLLRQLNWAAISMIVVEYGILVKTAHLVRANSCMVFHRTKHLVPAAFRC
jgi:hypothetical protein